MNKQAELDYSQTYGICTIHKHNFKVDQDGDVVVLDRQNRSDKLMGVQRFESRSNEVPIGNVTKSRYLLVTEEEYGCIYHQYSSKK